MFEADMGNAGSRWPLIRIRGGCESEITLLSRKFFVLTTHFLRYTVPCAVEDCELCQLLPSRGLFYVAGLCQGRRSMLELGVYSANDFEQHAKLLHGGMRPGLVFRLSRSGKRTPIRSEVVREVAGCGEIDARTLSTRVLAVYKFPPPNPCESMEAYEERIRGFAQRRNKHLAREIEAGKSGCAEARGS